MLYRFQNYFPGSKCPHSQGKVFKDFKKKKTTSFVSYLKDVAQCKKKQMILYLLMETIH